MKNWWAFENSERHQKYVDQGFLDVLQGSARKDRPFSMYWTQNLRPNMLLSQLMLGENPVLQGDQDHFLIKEMLISLSILQLHKNP